MVRRGRAQLEDLVPDDRRLALREVGRRHRVHRAHLEVVAGWARYAPLEDARLIVLQRIVQRVVLVAAVVVGARQRPPVDLEERVDRRLADALAVVVYLELAKASLDRGGELRVAAAAAVRQPRLLRSAERAEDQHVLAAPLRAVRRLLAAADALARGEGAFFWERRHRFFWLIFAASAVVKKTTLFTRFRLRPLVGTVATAPAFVATGRCRVKSSCRDTTPQTREPS